MSIDSNSLLPSEIAELIHELDDAPETRRMIELSEDYFQYLHDPDNSVHPMSRKFQEYRGLFLMKLGRELGKLEARKEIESIGEGFEKIRSI